MYQYDIPLKVRSTERTPSLEYDPKDGSFTIKGASVPENAKLFYEPIISWVDGYVNYIAIKSSDVSIVVNVELDYFSTKSMLCLVSIFKKFETLNTAKINWIYDDVDIEECGRDLATMINVEFNFINKS
jgi:hypothetical protein